MADGLGSPETWNRPGTGQQGIQGPVFFQSSVAVPTGSIASVCPDTALLTCVEVDTGAYAGVAAYLAYAGDLCPTAVTVDGQGGTLNACTDGAGNIFLFGSVSSAITAGNGQATGPSTTSEPGCELSPPVSTGQPSCTGVVLTLSGLASVDTVAAGNSFNLNYFDSETLAGAYDGSGPFGEVSSGGPTYVDGSSNAAIQNTWTSNTTSPANSPCAVTTAVPACGL